MLVKTTEKNKPKPKKPMMEDKETGLYADDDDDDEDNDGDKMIDKGTT